MGIQVSKIGEFKGHQQSIYALAAIDAKHFLSAGGDGMLVKWDIDSPDGKLIARIPEQLFCIAFDPRTQYCAVGTRAGSIYEIDTLSLQLQRQWMAHSGSVFGLLYEHGNLLSIGEDGVVNRWKPAQVAVDLSRKISSKSLRCIWMDEETLWLGGSEGLVWQLDGKTLEPSFSFQAGNKSIFALTKRKDRLITAGRDAHLHSWVEGKEQNDIAAHWYTIHALSQSADGKYLATGSMDKSIKIWDAESLELLKVIDHERYQAHRSSVNHIIWLSPTLLISGSDDRMIYGFEITKNHKS